MNKSKMNKQNVGCGNLLNLEEIDNVADKVVEKYN